jgi:Ni/Co efflux regulator RcnB
MKIQVALISLAMLTGFGLGAPAASSTPADDHAAMTAIQYTPPPNRYPDQRSYPDDRRDGYYPSYPPPRGGYDQGYGRNGQLWRPGEVLTPDLLDFIVEDWERRGLERPPGGHFWVRVDPQFILVRERDRMISRIVSFD